MAKKSVLHLLLVSLLFTGCSSQTSHSFTSQSESSISSSASILGTHFNDITSLKACDESTFNEASLYFDPCFQPVSLPVLHDTYFQQSQENSFLLLEPIRITPFYKTDDTALQFQDADFVSKISDSKNSLELNQSFSQIPGEIQFEEGYIAFYFYPKVSKKDYDNNEILSQKIQIGEKTYCDGIYELRWSKEIDTIS